MGEVKTHIDLSYLTEAVKDAEALRAKKVREHWQAPEAPEAHDAAIKTAPAILASAMAHMDERAKQYDAPAGERSMAATVELFNSLTGRNLTEVEGWKFMVLLKLVRAESAKGKALQDSFEDAVAYMALAGEAALK